MLDKPLEPPLIRVLLLIVVLLERGALDLLVAADTTGVANRSLLGTGGLLHRFGGVGMSVCRNFLRIGMSANRASVRHRAVLGTCRVLRHAFIGMSKRIREVGCIPLTTDRTSVLVVSLRGAGGCYPNGFGITVFAAIVNAIQYKPMIRADRHALDVAAPAVDRVSHLFSNRGRYNRAAVRKLHAGDHSFPVLGVEDHGVSGQPRFHDRAGNNIHGRGRGNGVGNAVAVQIPANENLGILLSTLERKIGLTDHLRGHKDLAGNQFAIRAVEAHSDPLVTIHYFVAVVPVRIVFIPTNVLFIVFHINGDAGDRKVHPIVECSKVHSDTARKHDVLEREWEVGNIAAKIIADAIRHIGDNECFQIG